VFSMALVKQIAMLAALLFIAFQPTCLEVIGGMLPESFPYVKLVPVLVMALVSAGIIALGISYRVI